MLLNSSVTYWVLLTSLTPNVKQKLKNVLERFLEVSYVFDKYGSLVLMVEIPHKDDFNENLKTKQCV